MFREEHEDDFEIESLELSQRDETEEHKITAANQYNEIDDQHMEDEKM